MESATAFSDRFRQGPQTEQSPQLAGKQGLLQVGAAS
jgi:hypothetical protein